MTAIVYAGQTFHPLPACGATSSVYQSADGLLVLKMVQAYHEYHVYEREKALLQRLQAYAWCPRLVRWHDKKKWLLLEHCGTPIHRADARAVDWAGLRAQFDVILADLASEQLAHNDIKCDELLLDAQGQLRLCDFGWGSCRGSHALAPGMWDGDKPCGIQPDCDAIRRCWDSVAESRT